jgi:glyoxylase-like metal-dependent hydrolase (beta-lactamase superfamily II)/pimeloyl-ACP methyl ester carboxylesterase
MWMQPPSPLVPPGFAFRRRAHPSANTVFVEGRWPILVDTGFVTAAAETVRLVEAMRASHEIGLGILTHFHSDHAGGACELRERFGVPIALHRTEAVSVNSRAADACHARWLHHPVAPFCADVPLEDGEVLSTGTRDLRVVHVPGQTPGHIALFADEDRVLISGDMLQEGDVAWLPPLSGDLRPLREAMRSLERLDRLGAAVALPGHGPVVPDPARAIAAALDRYERWVVDPEPAAWHALKRLSVSALMLQPLHPTTAPAALASARWLRDYARIALDREPAEVASRLLADLERAGAIGRRSGRLVAAVEHEAPDGPVPAFRDPATWPPCRPLAPRAPTRVLELPQGRLEYVDVPATRDGPPIVMLHEGLGSVALWKGFLPDLAAATGLRVIAYSRFGHGWSDRPPAARTHRFMEDEALEILPQVRERLRVDPPILLGHSGGATMALIHASERVVAGVVAIAPHVLVEGLTLGGIRSTVRQFESGELRARLARHHRDPEACFRGWSDVWLDPGFETWTIEPLLPRVTCDVLVLQGDADPYGSMVHLRTIKRLAGGRVDTLGLPCGHAPHLERPRETLAAVEAFVRRFVHSEP